MTFSKTGFDELLGRSVGGFVLLREIGTGASSTVYQAMDTETGARLVAVKIMGETEQRLRLAEGIEENPFEREYRFSQVVRDPGLVQVIASGQLEDGRFYGVMEFLEGMTVEEELARRGRYPCDEALEIIERTSDAVWSLHQKNIIHRDLKPGNLMTRLGKHGQLGVKVLDFGLAKLAHERDNTAAGFEPGAFGTPIYMAPEQARGLGTSPQTDVYALGAILYELIGGRPVLSLKHRASANCIAYLQADRPIPSIPLVDLVPETPGVVLDLLRATLVRNPDDRLPHAGAVAEATRSIRTALNRRRQSLWARLAAYMRGGGGGKP